MTAFARYALLLLLVAAGCRIPKEAGLPDVKRILDERGITGVRWRRGGEEEEQIDARVRELLRGELLLASATEIALLNNPRLQATYERLGIAQADVVQAGLLRNPTIAGHIGVPIGAGLSELEASLGWNLLDAILIPLRKRFAEAEFRRVKLDVANEVLEIVAQVRAAYFTVQASQQILAMRHVVAEAEQSAAELYVRQQAAGNTSDLDLVAEQGLYAQVKLEVAHAETQLLTDREHLNELLGLWGSAVGWKIVAPLPEVPKDELPLDHVESYAIAHRLDLQVARAEAEAVAVSLGLTRGSRFIGALDVGAGTHRDSDGPRTIGPTVSLELPIFDQRQAQVARLEAQFRQSRRRAEALAVGIRAQVRALRVRLLAQRATGLFYRDTLLPLRERYVLLSQAHYNAMLLGVYQLLQAKQSEINTYREYLETVRDYWIARAELERAAGGPLAANTIAKEPAGAAREGDRK